MVAISSIMKDAVRIGKTVTPKLVKERVELVLGTGDTIPVLGVTARYSLEDYQNKMTSLENIRLLLPGGTYQSKLLPNKDNVMVYQYTTRRGKTTLKKWRAVIQGYGDKHVEGNDLSEGNETALNTQRLEEINIQLMEPAVEKMRVVEIGGNYQATTPENLVNTLMGSKMLELGLNGADRFQGMEIYPFDNQTLYNQYVIQPIKLYDLPGYLQHHERNGVGLYYTGVGSFFRDNKWFIWPLLHTRRFSKVSDGITIVRVPPKLLPTLETTYELNDGQLTILVTGEGKYIDTSNNTHYNRGNGARVVTADSVAGDTGVIQDRGKALKVRSESVREFKTVDRQTGVDYAPVEETVTNNIYRIMQRNALADGAFLQANWQNSDPSLVKPGTPVRYIYSKGDTIAMRYGVVIRMETHEQIDNGSKVDSVFHIDTGLTLFLENEDAT